MDANVDVDMAVTVMDELVHIQRWVQHSYINSYPIQLKENEIETIMNDLLNEWNVFIQLAIQSQTIKNDSS